MSTDVLTQATDRHLGKTGAAAIVQRVQQLLAEEIDFIPNASFSDADADAKIPPIAGYADGGTSSGGQLRSDLPGHLARLCEADLLSAAEESRLFCRMNYLKYKVVAIRQSFDAKRPSSAQVSLAERYLVESRAIREQILKANMRLVMSIVKKSVTPQHSFDELLSDGIYSLMQAVEKFDFDRGFRFSTYAYRAITRSVYRKIKDHQRESTRFAVNSEEAAENAVEHGGASSFCDDAWDRLRHALSQMIDRLDRREQFIVRSRYALGAHRKVRTFQYLADKLGVSKERVRQLEQRAVAKLQSFAAEKPVDEVVGPTFG